MADAREVPPAERRQVWLRGAVKPITSGYEARCEAVIESWNLADGYTHRRCTSKARWRAPTSPGPVSLCRTHANVLERHHQIDAVTNPGAVAPAKEDHTS